jgi:hypothetical protein
MFNRQLLQINLTYEELQQVLQKRRVFKFGKEYTQKLPAYVIACCPFDGEKYVEHVNTYAISDWGFHVHEPGTAFYDVFDASHCTHFMLVQSFMFLSKAINGFVPSPGFRPSQPYVNGFALEMGYAKAVIHVLPLCEWTGESFEPLHNLFVISYFSEDAETARMKIRSEAINRLSDVHFNTYFMYPRKNKREGHWYDLSYWVERSLLYWIDADALVNDQPCLRTKDVDAFPYKKLARLLQSS